MTKTHQSLPYLKLAELNPKLAYDYQASEKLAQFSGSLLDLIEEYFSTQPLDYRTELQEFSKLNTRNLPSTYVPQAWVFVPCFNEDANLNRIIEIFDAQQDSFGHHFELCFIINCPKSKSNYRRLLRSLDILMEAKRCRPNIHIVTKVFSPDDASLGRARKYGFDYCLHRISEQIAAVADTAFVICTEGDTLELDLDYLNKYSAYFRPGGDRLVQGEVKYPKYLIDKSEALSLFTKVRESVYVGQGSQPEELSEFGGIMPCGRNFAVSPSLYCRVAGIDPIRRAGPEDDIILGSDIVRLLGESTKVFAPVSLVTSPRREVLIIKAMLEGKQANLKTAYEDFHNAVEVRDYDTADIDKIVIDEFPETIKPSFVPTLLSQLYQWVLSSVLKSLTASNLEAKRIKQSYLEHRLGYWEKENLLWSHGCNWLGQLPDSFRVKYETEVADEALYWFQVFNESLGIRFQRSSDGILSHLLTPV